MPTPVNKKNEPDLKNLKDASKLVAKIIKKGHIVVIESTVYPGVTEEFNSSYNRKKIWID